MKRTLMILALMLTAFAAGAQYKPSGELQKKGGRLYMEGQKLTNEQISHTLSTVMNDEGVAYDQSWNSAYKMRTSGIVLTSVGSAACVAGSFVYIVGVAKVIASGIGAGIAGDPDGIVGENELVGGAVLLGSGVAMVGSGIPLWCVGGNRMKKVVNGYNSQLPASLGPDMVLAVGPCPNGIGLSLTF